MFGIISRHFILSHERIENFKGCYRHQATTNEKQTTAGESVQEKEEGLMQKVRELYLKDTRRRKNEEIRKGPKTSVGL